MLQLSLLEVFKPCLALLGQFNVLAMMGLCQGKHINNLDEVYLSKHVSVSCAPQPGVIVVFNWLVIESGVSIYWDEGLTTYYCLRVKLRLQAHRVRCGLGPPGL